MGGAATVRNLLAHPLTRGCDIDDPASNVSKLLRDNSNFRMHAELGTEPNFYYLHERRHVLSSKPGLSHMASGGADRALSPAEVGSTRLRPDFVPNPGKPEFGWERAAQWRSAEEWVRGLFEVYCWKPPHPFLPLTIRIRRDVTLFQHSY